MDVFECIKIRRSIRDYLDKPIPKEHLNRLLNVLRAAPSAANRQPWKFIVVTDPEKRRAMVERCGGPSPSDHHRVCTHRASLAWDGWQQDSRQRGC